MPTPNSALTALWNDYAEYAARPTGVLTLDERRGVAFYLADRDDAADVEPFVRRWIRNVHDVDTFRQQHGRLPRADPARPRPATDEQALVDVLAYFREVGNADGYCTYQRRRLEAIPGFAWRPRDARWEEMLQRHQQFWADNGRAPQRRALDGDEVSIGRWVAHQRARHRRGALPGDREQQLRRARYRIL
ncbi:helicase associated domain-containing protein [Curtobacterium sp. 458]|uniref:helicase associated domain-containing protein n=1 Tax=Curtobacterium sp. 458 TaxID=3050069 RepID=UPI0025B5E37B|nr:helicase associated domain-containing protein [Curtobacterium sp. 458]WJY00407.1 helicase associated domain-containing protein [Curtobacterium sp. 458]